MKRSMFLLLILTFGLTVPAFADIWSIDFVSALATGGSITAVPGGYLGSGIAVDVMRVFQGTNTPQAFGVVGGIVDFNTSSNTFTVVGNVLGLGPLTLVTGTPVAQTSTLGTLGGSGTFNLDILQPDFKNPLLLAELGIPADTKFELMWASFQVNSAGVVASVDVHNRSVPDGGVTLMLLGGALVGLETLRRKLRA